MSQNALAVRQDDDEVTMLAYLRDLSKDAADSRLFNGISREQATCLMLAGRDFGFSAMQSLRMFDLIKGKPALKADAIVGICKASPECEKFYRVSESDTEATWIAKRKGEPEQTSTFTIEDARRAKLLDQRDSGWDKYPKRMLNARAKAFLARDVFPDLVAGLLSSEEMISIQRADVDVRQVADVRHVPEPRPTPAPESGERPSHDVDAADFVQEMRNAMSVSELSAVGQRVGAFGFPAEIKAELLAVYKTHKARVTPPSDAGDAWEPARG